MKSLNLPKSKHADRILTHYITLALMQSGVNVDSDTFAELDGLIESAIQEAVNVAVAQALSAIPSEVIE